MYVISEINSIFGLGWLQAALEKCQGQVLKLERDLYLEIEPQTARNIHGSTMPSGEFTTPVASRQEQGDENLTDDTVILYSNSLASRSKVEQLKLQVSKQYRQWLRGAIVVFCSEHPMFSSFFVRTIKTKVFLLRLGCVEFQHWGFQSNLSVLVLNYWKGISMQSQNLLRMAANRQPWRIQGSPIDSMDEADDHPPPSATLHSHHENLTGPVCSNFHCTTRSEASIYGFFFMFPYHLNTPASTW